MASGRSFDVASGRSFDVTVGRSLEREGAGDLGGGETVGQVRPGPVHDLVALAEIELCGELIIAASATAADRLSLARIDEVLRVDEEPETGEGPGRAGGPAAP